jgi:type I restriction enzyme M protein
MSPTQAIARTLVRDPLLLIPEGPVVDFLDPSSTRPNKPEEHVRQNYARKLHYEYGYAKDQMVFGAPISIGSETRYADIVVYDTAHAAKRKDQAKIRLIVETKAPDVKSGETQLQSYIFASSAEGGVWINETDAPKYWRREGRHLTEWPNLPHAREEWDAVGKHKKRQLRAPHNLVETFKRCHNALYKQGINSEDLAMDMVRVILAKYQDEQNEGETCEFRCTPQELQSEEGRERVANRVRDLFIQVREANADVFGLHEAITAGDREVATVVSELQDFRFLPDPDSDEVYDVVGAAYEVYVGSHLKGDRGQYFTQRLIVQLLVRLVDPEEKDVILDPAMGSGGFLIAAMRHVTTRISRSRRSAAAKTRATAEFHRRIYGIDKSPKLVKVARTNMILASDGHSGIVHGDTLELPEKLPKPFLRGAGPGLPTVILTNPPFGATSEHRITANRQPEILMQFSLGRAWSRDEDGVLRPGESFTGEGVPPEYLFAERCIRWVKPGGKVGIVLPRGILDNDKALPLRTLILNETRVLAVVNCHDDTFKPHTDAKCALLVLQKNEPGAVPQDYPIFMAISQGIGHNGVGDPIYKTDAKGDPITVDGKLVLDEDTGDVFQAWTLLNQGQPSPSGNYFQIRRRDLAPQGLNLNPVRYLPKYNESRKHVLTLGEQSEWTVERLGEFAQVFNGPRLKRPYADKGVTAGPTIVRFFTGNAVTQTRGENIKFLDLAKAKPAQLRMIEKLYLRRGMILVTRSGTVGRVVYATAYHDRAVGTEDVIRIVIDDEALRGYVFQFLGSQLGQDQLKANIYGAIVDHIEPDHVKDVLVPVPTDRRVVEDIGLAVIRAIEHQEFAYTELECSRLLLREVTQVNTEEDERDGEVARRRLKELEEDPSLAVSGDELRARLEALLV